MFADDPAAGRALTAQTQLPAMQCFGGEQDFPQPPQLLLSKLVLTQTPEQYVPTTQAQTPPVHTAPPVQSTPQAPQLRLLELVLVQLPPQLCVPGAQLQNPDAQICPASHLVPHAPQFVGSFSSRVQLPAH
jgi:hypothetical protein